MKELTEEQIFGKPTMIAYLLNHKTGFMEKNPHYKPMRPIRYTKYSTTEIKGIEIGVCQICINPFLDKDHIPFAAN